jgi:hypothetical protein
MERHAEVRAIIRLSTHRDRTARRRGAAGAPAAPDTARQTAPATQTGPTQRCTYPWY